MCRLHRVHSVSSLDRYHVSSSGCYALLHRVSSLFRHVRFSCPMWRAWTHPRGPIRSAPLSRRSKFKHERFRKRCFLAYIPAYKVGIQERRCCVGEVKSGDRRWQPVTCCISNGTAPCRRSAYLVPDCHGIVWSLDAYEMRQR